MRRSTLLALLALVTVPGLARADSVSFAPTGAEQSWVVLPGVSSVEVTATGAAGGLPSGAGGFGAVVHATIPVTVGEVLFVNVGGAGTVPTDTFGGGGFNGGGPGYGEAASPADASGGGGGATDVRTCSRLVCPVNSLVDTRVLVAAGGGGRGGGAAGGAGGVGALGGSSAGGPGAGAATATGGGGGGSAVGGGPGAPGGGAAGRTQGGPGAFASAGSGSGGGGGGGSFGGGGGGAGDPGTGGGGGGAGSSFASPTATNVSFATAGSTGAGVTLTYVQRLPEIAVPVGAAFGFPGIQPRGTTSAPQTLTLRNGGLAPLVIGEISVTGQDAADFALAANGCTAAVPPDGSCTLLVTFSPTAAGVRRGGLRVSSNDLTDPTVDLALSGEGGVPKVVLEPPAGLAFGPQAIATVGSPKELTVRNTGNAPLVVAGVEIISSTDFVLGTNGCATPVAPGATCAVSLRFFPRAPGVRQGILRVRSNDPGAAAADTSLTGTGATRAELRAPVITQLAVTPRTFAAANLGGPVAPASRQLSGARPRVGGQVGFRLSASASLRFTVERALPGVRVGSRCVARPRTGAAGRTACTRYVTVRGGFTYVAKTGRNGFLFSGRLGGRSLAGGSYRLLAVATDGAKRRSAVARASFRIVG